MFVRPPVWLFILPRGLDCHTDVSEELGPETEEEDGRGTTGIPLFSSSCCCCSTMRAAISIDMRDEVACRLPACGDGGRGGCDCDNEEERGGKPTALDEEAAVSSEPQPGRSREV